MSNTGRAANFQSKAGVGVGSVLRKAEGTGHVSTLVIAKSGRAWWTG